MLSLFPPSLILIPLFAEIVCIENGFKNVVRSLNQHRATYVSPLWQ